MNDRLQSRQRDSHNHLLGAFLFGLSIRSVYTENNMKRITVREFRAHISSYLTQIKEGEIIEVNGIAIGLCTRVIEKK